MTADAPDFSWPVRVYWEDTDAGGIVFYANYLKFFERARTEWLRHLGIEQHALREVSGGMFVVSATAVRYHQSARLDDLLDIRTYLKQAGRASLVLEQSAWRMDSPQPTCLSEGEIRIGWVEAKSIKPARIPSSILERLKPT
ncbi:MAG: Acyl-CoA thioester hydrolase YbgC [Pseudomonadota bacterium]|jgi:acyl-CoA thioester hydrolase